MQGKNVPPSQPHSGLPTMSSEPALNELNYKAHSITRKIKSGEAA